MKGEFERDIESWTFLSTEFKCIEKNIKKIAKEMIEEAKKEFEEAFTTNKLHEVWKCYGKWFGDNE